MTAASSKTCTSSGGRRGPHLIELVCADKELSQLFEMRRHHVANALSVPIVAVPLNGERIVLRSNRGQIERPVTNLCGADR